MLLGKLENDLNTYNVITYQLELRRKAVGNAKFRSKLPVYTVPYPRKLQSTLYHVELTVYTSITNGRWSCESSSQ